MDQPYNHQNVLLAEEKINKSLTIYVMLIFCLNTHWSHFVCVDFSAFYEASDARDFEMPEISRFGKFVSKYQYLFG